MQNLNKYIDYIKSDYARDKDPIAHKWMLDRFEENFKVVDGKKFIKICTPGAHTFIVKQACDKFKEGDILKAAGWNTPAKNFARGNVIEGKWQKVRWTGA